MEIEKLKDMLRNAAGGPEGIRMCHEAADALGQLQAENEKLKAQVPRWIPVEERLPDKPGHYLVCTRINYWHGGCMDVNQERKYRDSGTPVGYDGTTMSVLDCYYDITGDWNRACNQHVTHWMPLPKPPKEATHD